MVARRRDRVTGLRARCRMTRSGQPPVSAWRRPPSPMPPGARSSGSARPREIPRSDTRWLAISHSRAGIDKITAWMDTLLGGGPGKSGVEPRRDPGPSSSTSGFSDRPQTRNALRLLAFPGMRTCPQGIPTTLFRSRSHRRAAALRFRADGEAPVTAGPGAEKTPAAAGRGHLRA